MDIEDAIARLTTESPIQEKAWLEGKLSAYKVTLSLLNGAIGEHKDKYNHAKIRRYAKKLKLEREKANEENRVKENKLFNQIAKQ